MFVLKIFSGEKTGVTIRHPAITLFDALAIRVPQISESFFLQTDFPCANTLLDPGPSLGEDSHPEPYEVIVAPVTAIGLPSTVTFGARLPVIRSPVLSCNTRATPGI